MYIPVLLKTRGFKGGQNYIGVFSWSLAWAIFLFQIIQKDLREPMDTNFAIDLRLPHDI